MSQYLSHLAGLALNKVDIVQPRLASRFEATDGVDSAPVDINQPQEISRPIAPAAQNVAAEPAITHNNQPTRVTSLDDKTPFSPVIPTSLFPVAPPVSPSRPLPQLDKDVPKSATTRIEETHTREKIVEIRQPLLQPVIVKTVAATDEKQAGTVASSFAAPDALDQHLQRKPAPITPELPATSNPPLSKTSEQQTQPPAVKPARISIPVPSSIVPSLPVRDVLSGIANERDVTPMPTIQVTIGRIEIRANQSAGTTPAKSRQTSNTMTLDDYLKQRNGEQS